MIGRVVSVLLVATNFYYATTWLWIYMHPPRDRMIQVHVRCLDPTTTRYE